MAAQRVEVGGHHGGEGLALPGPHLDHLALVEGDGGEHLDVEGIETGDPAGGLTNQRVGPGQQEIVRRVGLGGGGDESRAAPEIRIGELFELLPQAVDLGQGRGVGTQVEFDRGAAQTGKALAHAHSGFFTGRSWTRTLTGSGLWAVVRARSSERWLGHGRMILHGVSPLSARTRGRRGGESRVAWTGGSAGPPAWNSAPERGFHPGICFEAPSPPPRRRIGSAP